MTDAIVNVSSLPWIDAKDEDSIDLLAPLLRRRSPVMIEAGFCGAEDTLALKRQWPDAIIYCFEAHPETFEYGKGNIIKSGIAGITPNWLALSDMDGVKDFYMSQMIPAASSLFKDNISSIVAGETYDDRTCSVPCSRLDTWAKRNNVDQIDFMWLDAEGAELDILNGAGALLSGVSVIRIEMNHREFRSGISQFNSLYSFLIGKQFRLECIWGSCEWQSNGIFVKQ